MPDGEVDIHTIWKIWGAGGLIEKLGPDRAIRELKKRGEAGAIIGWTLYKLLIDKWMDVALSAVDAGERGPAEDFMAAAGEDELVRRIEELHVKYPQGIPRSIKLDLRDEFNDNLQRKVGRTIPLDPRDASKKDVEESKRIAAGLSKIEGAAAPTPAPRPPAPAPEIKPAERPVERAPPPVGPPAPIVKIPSNLELMQAEIRRRIDDEKRRRMGGGGVAGEARAPVEQRAAAARRIVSGMEPGERKEEVEMSPVFVRCPGRPGFGMCLYCRFKYIVTSISSCPYSPEFRGTFRESDIKKLEDMVRETEGSEAARSYREYVRILERIRGVDNLSELKRVYASIDVLSTLTEYDKLQLKLFLMNRMQQVLELQEIGKPAAPARFREDSRIRENEDTMTEPGDYSQWTFGDFEGLIASLEDIEDLEELYEYIDASDNLSEIDKITLRNLVKTRIDELAAGYSELSKIRG